MNNKQETMKAFNLFLRATSDLYNNKNYIKALTDYFQSGVKPSEEVLIKGSLNSKREKYQYMINKEYFEKSLVIVNSNNTDGRIIDTYQKELNSRFENMLKRIDNYKKRTTNQHQKP